MSGIGRRLTSRKDKEGESSYKREKSRENRNGEKSIEKKSRSMSEIFTTLFNINGKSKSENEELDEKAKIARIRSMLEAEGRNDVKDENITFCLSSIYANGNIEKAHEILVIIQESLSGIVYPYDPKVKLVGAINYTGVTCWLDSLLFSVFLIPTQFQDLLGLCYEDSSKQSLIQLLRLWVNLLRKGILIEGAITERVLDTLIECGWTDFEKRKEQDPTEAHIKIGDILDWPMLSLRLDYLHEGIENEQDDHLTTKTRTIQVHIPTNHQRPYPPKLEDCIRESLVDAVKVRRRAEPDPPGSTRDNDEKPTLEQIEIIEAEKPSTLHFDNMEVESVTGPPGAKDMLSQAGSQTQLDENIKDEQSRLPRSSSSHDSTRKGDHDERDVNGFIFSRIISPSTIWPSMPAAANNQELAIQIHNRRPMLGFDLKRYGPSPDGQSQIRINTHIDIPKKMKLPTFANQYGSQDDTPITDLFELVLRSMICHSGEKMDSGHYTSLVRLDIEETGDELDSAHPKDSQKPPDYAEDHWIAHDDVQNEKVFPADINAALNHDKYGMPVTLWYELVPMLGNLSDEELQQFQNHINNTTPPTYTNSSVPSIDVQVSKASPGTNSGNGDDEGYFPPPLNDIPNTTIRFSSEIGRPRASLNLPDENRRASVAATDTSSVSAEKSDNESTPVTPAEEPEPSNSRTSRTFRRSKASRSRPQSSSNGDRKTTLNYFTTKLMSRASKESLHKTDQGKGEISGLDGTHDSKPNGESLKKGGEGNGMLSRKGSKKGKRRSKGAAEIEGKDKDHPDRVCNTM